MPTRYALGDGVTLPSLVPGADGPTSLSKRGEELIIPWYQQWIHAGRGYIASNAAKQTALAVGGTSYSDTAPAFLLDVPSGTTVIPLSIRLRQGGTVAGGVITVLVTADVVTRYSSGGTAQTPRNMKLGPNAGTQRASLCSFYSGPTLSAVNTHISLVSTILTQDVATTPSSKQTIFDYPEPGAGATEPMPELIGPAALIVYAFAGTTQPSWFWSFKWIELDS